ncbi:Hypothetical predicted protein, partial [Pelobates cultripes]
DRRHQLRKKLMRILCLHKITARAYMSILGSLSSTIGLTRWAQWHIQIPQRFFLTQYKHLNLNQPIHLKSKVKEALKWRLSKPNLTKGFPLGDIPWMVVTTDASQTVSGAHLYQIYLQGKWPVYLRGASSNYLE